jgi:hypothetical protein
VVRLITEEWKRQNARVKWIVGGLNWDDLSDLDKRFTKPDTLTDWEREFIESIEVQSDEGKILSTKQMGTLERIYKEKGR